MRLLCAHAAQDRSDVLPGIVGAAAYPCAVPGKRQRRLRRSGVKSGPFRGREIEGKSKNRGESADQGRRCSCSSPSWFHRRVALALGEHQPDITAAAVILTMVSVVLLATMEGLRRRNERLKGNKPRSASLSPLGQIRMRCTLVNYARPILTKLPPSIIAAASVRRRASRPHPCSSDPRQKRPFPCARRSNIRKCALRFLFGRERCEPAPSGACIPDTSVARWSRQSSMEPLEECIMILSEPRVSSFCSFCAPARPPGGNESSRPRLTLQVRAQMRGPAWLRPQAPKSPPKAGLRSGERIGLEYCPFRATWTRAPSED